MVWPFEKGPQYKDPNATQCAVIRTFPILRSTMLVKHSFRSDKCPASYAPGMRQVAEVFMQKCPLILPIFKQNGCIQQNSAVRHFTKPAQRLSTSYMQSNEREEKTRDANSNIKTFLYNPLRLPVVVGIPQEAPRVDTNAEKGNSPDSCHRNSYLCCAGQGLVVHMYNEQ